MQPMPLDADFETSRYAAARHCHAIISPLRLPPIALLRHA